MYSEDERNIEIDGNKFTVKWFKFEEFEDDRKCPIPSNLQDPPIQSSPSNILNALNDDCLWEIFNSKELDVWDLCALAEVCKRFNDIAKGIVPIKHRHIIEHTDHMDHMEWKCLWRMERLFRHFGSSFTTFKGLLVENWDVLCGLIGKHCDRITTLDCELNEPATLYEIRPLIQRLYALNVTFRQTIACDYQLSELFDSQPIVRLETLTISANDNTLDMPHIPLINLRHL